MCKPYKSQTSLVNLLQPMVKVYLKEVAMAAKVLKGRMTVRACPGLEAIGAVCKVCGGVVGGDIAGGVLPLLAPYPGCST